MEGSENSPISVSIEMKAIPKTKYGFRQEGYIMDRPKMGICYVINNVDQEQPATRRDVWKCEKVFTNLGFDVNLYLNQTKNEMKALRRNVILNDEKYKNCNCLVIVIIAHGSNKRNIFDVKGKTAWNLDVLEEQIGRISSLAGRPKILFVEACRGQQQHRVIIPTNLGSGIENGTTVSMKDTEEEEDEDYVMLMESGWGGSSTCAGINSGTVEIGEKTEERGIVAAMNSEESSIMNSEQAMPSKRDQFIGLSTVENYVAFTVSTSGSPYLQNLMKELSEECFLESLQAIHQTTRKKVGKNPVHEHRYMIPDEHNRLHDNLCFNDYLLHQKNGSHPLKKGRVSYESTVMLIGVTYNILEHCAGANQLLNYGHEELAESFYDLPKGSMVQNSEDIPTAFMEIFTTSSEYFYNANNLLINAEHLDISKICDRLVSTKPCPGFNVIEDVDRDKKKHIITFHKEYPMVKISMSQDNKEMFLDKNSSAINFDCPEVFRNWIGKCPIPICIEDIYRYSVFLERYSIELEDEIKHSVQDFCLYWKYFFGKFMRKENLKEAVTLLSNKTKSGENTKAPLAKFFIDCHDYFVYFECPKEIQNGEVVDFTLVKLEEVSKEYAKETYSNFLNYWGHHFVSEFSIGGSITLTLLLTTDDLKNVAQIKNYLNNICSDEHVEEMIPIINPPAVVEVQFTGGDIEYQRQIFDDINVEQMRKWKESLKERPTPLMSNVTILPMYSAVACLDHEKGEIVRQLSEEILEQGTNWITTELIHYEETVKYTGETIEGNPHGKGTLISKYGEYTGNFKKGNKSGHGKCNFTRDDSTLTQNLIYYAGEWVDDKPHGYGEGHFINGNVYIGQWKSGNPEGLGTVFYEDGKEAIVLCRKGHVEEVIKGEAQNMKVGTEDQNYIKSKMEDYYNVILIKLKNMGKFKQVSIILAILFLMVVIFSSVIAFKSLKVLSCTETLKNKFDTVSVYDYTKAGFLDVDLFRLDDSTRLTCENSQLFMDLFQAPNMIEQEIFGQISCTSHKIPKSSYVFNKANKMRVVKRVYGRNIIRFRTCNPEKHNCSDIANSNDIRCTSVKEYNPLTCLHALANQWDHIARYNSIDNSLTVDTRLLSWSTRHMCQLDLNSVNLEIFAVSPSASEDKTEFYSCGSFPNQWVLPFRPKMILNGTDSQTVRYVSGSFIFRLSRDQNSICTYPERVYKSKNEENIMDIWESKTCQQIPNVMVLTGVQQVPNLHNPGALTCSQKISPNETCFCATVQDSVEEDSCKCFASSLWEYFGIETHLPIPCQNLEKVANLAQIFDAATTKTRDNACIVTIPSFPFLDCFIMDKTLTATMKLKILNETQHTCDDSGILQEDVANIKRKSAADRTPILEDVTFKLPMNVTFCLEAILNYPLCPSRNKEDENKCSRPVGGPLQLINCKKQWGKKQ